MHEWMTDKIGELQAEITVLKAERDEAIDARDGMEKLLLGLLARVHRDGGQYVDENGLAAACADADLVIVASYAAIDRLKGELETVRKRYNRLLSQVTILPSVNFNPCAVCGHSQDQHEWDGEENSDRPCRHTQLEVGSPRSTCSCSNYVEAQ